MARPWWLVTHDLGVVASICDRVIVLYGGRIMESGRSTTSSAIRSIPIQRALLASMPRLDEKMHARLNTIPGQPPSLARETPGCPFAPRCPIADEYTRMVAAADPDPRRPDARVPQGDAVTEPLLAVSDLKVHFPLKRQGLFGEQRTVRAVDGVSFELQPGRDARHRRRVRLRQVHALPCRPPAGRADRGHGGLARPRLSPS